LIIHYFIVHEAYNYVREKLIMAPFRKWKWDVCAEWILLDSWGRPSYHIISPNLLWR